MFQSLITNIKSWAIKIFLGIIALSFAVWGVGDLFRGNTDPIVASIGSTNIRASEIAKEYNNELEKIRQMSAGEIDAEQARALGIVRTTVQNIMGRESIDKFRADLGMAVPDSLVIKEIKSSTKFRNQEGDFDQEIFEYVAIQNGMNTETFIETLRGDILRAQLLDSLITGVRTPTQMATSIQKFRDEKRNADIIIIDGEELINVPNPEETDLYSYHDTNRQRFMEPEYRTASLAMIRPADLISEITISEDEISNEYEYRLDEFIISDQVDLNMGVFPTEEMADKALNRINNGENFVDVIIGETGVTESDIRLGPVSRNEVLVEIADYAFTMNVSQVSTPVKSDFGLHLLQANEVIQGRTLEYSEASEILKQDLMVERAIDLVFELSDRFEDELGGGATLEEAARSLGIKVSTVEMIDAAGFGIDRILSDQLPVAPGLLEIIFESETNTDVPFFEAPGNTLFKIRVAHIVSPTLQPLDKVRERVISAWKADWQNKNARETAAEFKDRAVDISFASAAQEYNLEILRGKPFTRDGTDLEFRINDAAIRSIFELRTGEITDAIKISEGRYAVAILTNIISNHPTTDTISLSLNTELRNSIQNDIFITLQTALQSQYGVKINEQLLNNLF